MITFPNAKVNIGLNILSKRDDGYHNIETCMYPVGWIDVLEIVKSTSFKFTSSGYSIDEDISENLCVKAYNLLNEYYGLPNVHIHLHKVIPMGAGLGGGSSDAAFTLKMLNSMFSLRIDNETLIKYASKLGSDCAFFIDNKPTIAFDIGDKFDKVSINLQDKKMVIIYPDIHIATKEAYQQVRLGQPEVKIYSILNEPVESWKEILYNDFEKSLFEAHPILQNIKSMLYELGAQYASLSGSGSAIYGIFEQKDESIANKFPQYKVKEVIL